MPALGCNFDSDGEGFDGRREATLRDRIDRKKRTPLNSWVLVFCDRSDRASRRAAQADPSNRDSSTVET
jgi:hypothetical protein